MEWKRIYIVIASSLVFCVVCAPVQDSKEDLLLAKQFMARFGYIETGDSASVSLIKVEQAIKDVQRFGGIAQTGQLDNSTLQLMKSERCGVPDVLLKNTQRKKRYALSPSLGWTKKHLTYFVANWSPKLGQSAVRSEMQRALAVWAKYGRLQFKEVVSPDADIVVSFGRGYHGDSYPFDGAGLTLAHAFFPAEHGSLGGDVHFDDDEAWKQNPGEFEDGIDFFAVAVHEIGHSLGLSHSDAEGSIMNPYYKRYDRNAFSLGYDDILAMYELYITKPAQGGNESWDDEKDQDDEQRRRTTTTTTTTTQPPPPPPTTTATTTVSTPSTTMLINYIGDVETVETHKSHDPTHNVPDPVEPLLPAPEQPVTAHEPTTSGPPDACLGHYSAVAYLRNELFVFKQNYIWRLSRPGNLLPGFPVPIQRMFNKLPTSLKKIDAAYERNTDSNIIFFSGDRYWVYNGNEIVDGSPRPISDYGLPDHVKQIDAIMVWARNQKTYIFSGQEYWRFNESTRSLDSGYPKSLQMFGGVPSNLDSVMTWSDGITYFFKNNFYWAFNNTLLRTEERQVASQYWLGCHS